MHLLTEALTTLSLWSKVFDMAKCHRLGKFISFILIVAMTVSGYAYICIQCTSPELIRSAIVVTEQGNPPILQSTY